MTDQTSGRLSSWSPAQSLPRRVDAPRGERAINFLVWQALLGLLAFDLLGLGRNFARMHRCVSKWPVAAPATERDEVDRVCCAINDACVWYPKRVLCLQRSVVTTCLLRNRGIPAKMVMGAQSLPFKAHAWAEVNDRPINERNDVRKIYAIWERC